MYLFDGSESELTSELESETTLLLDDSSVFSNAFSIPIFSIFPPRLLMPAVSTKRNLYPSISTEVSRESVVVPGIFVTIDIFLPEM